MSTSSGELWVCSTDTPSITIHQSAQHFGRLSKLQAKYAQHFRRGAHNIYVKLTISQSQIYKRYIVYSIE